MIALADCAVTVTSAEDSARWWKENLGFAVHTVGGTGHAVLVAPPGDKFVLHLCEGFGAIEPGNTGIAFATDDIAALVRRMESGGVAFPEPLNRGNFGARAKFSDPDGNIFWLLEVPTAFLRREAHARAPLRAAGPTAERRRKAGARRAPRKPRRR